MRAIKTLILTIGLLAWPLSAMAEAQVHGLAMHGSPKYGPDFTHFDYVDPDAPKGGTIRLHDVGDAFDTLNPFALKGTPPGNIGLMYDTLLTHALDEPFTMYGLVAESLEVPDDRSWVVFNIRPEARFHDGEPITAEDVVFTHHILTTDGHPFYKFYYGSVDKVEALSERRVKFTFKPGENRELPLIVGEMQILPKHYWQGRDFAAATMEPPLGSGPYRIAKVEAGQSIAFERVADYWAADLPVTRGLYNFDSVVVDFYRDSTVALEAFKAHAYDWRAENSSKAWATAYDVPAVADGRLIKATFEHGKSSGMQSWAFNIRRDKFKDERVRLAIAQAFDFKWSNENLFYGQYTRTKSFFDNSELASRGLPDEAELALLEPWRGKIPDEVFTTEYAPPTTPAPGEIRGNLRAAFKLLKDAGYAIKDGKMTHTQTGGTLDFEILLVSPLFERVALPFAKNLERLGIAASVRTVDTATYKQRVENFDFDMIVGSWGQSLSPGNEQRNFWGSTAADTAGSRNWVGIKDPAIDALIEKVISAPDRAALVTATRALDRVLLWNHFVIPQWHIPYDRVAYWNVFGMPKTVPVRGVSWTNWWIDPAKAGG